MKTTEILQVLPTLSVEDRFKIAEAALNLSQAEQQALTKKQQRQQMAIAAKAAIEDYLPGSDLLAFDQIEDEDFYDYSDEDLDRLDRHE